MKHSSRSKIFVFMFLIFFSFPQLLLAATQNSALRAESDNIMKNKILHVVDLEKVNMKDISQVGGKNASLGEMINTLSKLGIQIPKGFATTADSYRDFLAINNLDSKIYSKLVSLDPNDIKDLAKTSKEIKSLILDAKFSDEFVETVTKKYQSIARNKKLTFAVRSSATAEDLPNASFAGQHDSFLNVQGVESILKAIKKVYASLFNERAIVYRIQNKFSHANVAMSATIQFMVRSDLGSSGVIFTLDTETGFDKAIFISSSWGLGEGIVQGIVNPDEFYVYKPSLNDNKPAILQRTLGNKALKIIYGEKNRIKTVKTTKMEQQKFSIDDSVVTELASFAMMIEKHYKKPMDIEWALDGETKKVYILQARPETVRSQEKGLVLEKFSRNCSPV